MVEQATATSAMTLIEQFHFASRFLGKEAKLLDERRFDEWIKMIHDDIVYEVPVRQAKQHYADEFIDGAFRLKDTMPIIKIRIERLRSGHAWAETPPSRTVRVVGSIFAEEGENTGDLHVESAMLIYRQRGNAEAGDIIPVRRSDIIRITDEGGLLVSRRAVIPDTVLRTPNLGVFL
jgi:3-phenylpropionate/cinnamic acid dioxygenase small subunit